MKQKTKRVLQKYLSLLLIAAILLTTQGVLAQAEMVTPDDAEKRQAETVTPDHAARRQTRGRELPANPVHHCTKKNDGTDYTDWSYVYFGSYPQTEVTGDALTIAITDAPYDGNGDAWVDGVKYRRIKKSDANYSSTGSDYFQWGSDEEYHYFKWERIKWRVLKNDGSTLFVVADKGLDCKRYNEIYTSITWEDCTLRSWLNNDFYNMAFSSGEQEAIAEQDVANEDNPEYGTEGGNDTRDNVYLLSIGEATNPAYGFCEDYSSTYSVSRRVQASDYAHARGGYTNTSGTYKGNSSWWLRSPGSSTDCAADVYANGDVYRFGCSILNYNVVCVPALHINVSSDPWSMADDGSSGEGGGDDTGSVVYSGCSGLSFIVEGYYHKAAITANGDLYCWGRNDHGQVGNGTTANQSIPIKILENVESVSLGWVSYSAAITANGDLYCWGQNDHGQIGNGTTEDQTIPVKVLENVVSVSMGHHSAAITTNGDLYCWGENDWGQVGNGTRVDQVVPVKVLENVESVSLDGDNNAAITVDGDLYTWGSNGNSQIGSKNAGHPQTTPIKVLENVSSVSLDTAVAGAITTNGDLYCWGWNQYGQIGNGTTTNQRTPVKVLSDVKFFSFGLQKSAAITTNGDLYCWGDNGGNTKIPTRVLRNVTSISMSGWNKAAITTNGDLYCWGSNDFGQIGDGTTDDRWTPVKILGNVVSTSLYSGHTSMAITADGELYCWGRNSSGEVGNGTTTDQETPAKILENVISASFYQGNAMAITMDGELYSWGSNLYGEVGNGKITGLQTNPVKILHNGTSGEGGSGSGEENGDITETGNQAIIDRVSEYTSDELYALYQNILNSTRSEETKYKVYQALFQDYGITDVHEGIRYLSNTTDKRRAYLALTTDDFYSAANYKHWLKNTAKGKAAQVVLLADGLIFNNEINDWLDFSTYLEKDYPGVAKYKAMLYDFMETSSDSIEIVSNIKLISDLSGKVTGAAKLKADNLIAQLNRCSTAAEAEKIMDSSAAMEVWIELAEVKDKNGNFVRDDNGSIKLTYRLDESSGFGQFAKAMGYATKGISLVDMAVSDFMDFKALDDKLAVYMQYQRFLQDIVSDTDGLPYQMRWAASLILTELEESYFGEIKDVAWEVVEETKINDIVLEKILGKIAVDNIKSWLNVIGIESFFVNKLADIGGMVKREACVEGYADLASAFTKKLERSKQTFLAARTEENAWDFYYNYNILYRLRYKGEEAYLDMTKVEGFLSYFSDFGYSLKKDVVDETLKMLEDKCQFTMDEAAALPESCQFVAKSVISCPVNVSVYAENGTLITELVDGTQSDVTNEYGRFAVVYDSYSGDYEKVICLNSEENVSFKITGVDDGLVAMDFAQAKDAESMVYTFNNVPIKMDAAIYADVKQITEQKIYQIDESGNGELDERPIIVKSDNYVPVDSVVLSETVLKLKEGESTGLKVMINPSNATEQKISWMSANPSVAAVTDGKVTAVTQGSTVIYGIAMDDRDKIVSCEVSVVADMGDIPVCEEHSWDDGIITKEPTCTERGEKTYTCVICGETKNEVIKATGHRNTEVRNLKEATESTEGYTGDIYCKDCNTKIETGEIIPALGNGMHEHIWNDGITTKEPTCTERGEKIYACTVCGETKSEEIKAAGHQTTEVRNKKDATCKAEGYSGDIYCKNCNTKIEDGQAIAATGKHTWDKGKENKTPSCTEKGEKQYTCSVCRETKKESLEKISHAYKTTVTKATTSKNGSITEKCASCGIVKSSKTIPCVKSATLRTVSYTYNGKAKKPSVTIKDSSGKVVSAHNYTVKYKNNKKIGKASVTIKLQGNYTGTIKKTFKIVPKGTAISGKVMAQSKGFTVKWKKQKKSTTGYQIQVSTNKKFAKKVTVTKTVKKNSTTKLAIKRLKPKKRYYVRVRTYKTVKGKKYCSGWSKVKTVITKK